MSNQEFIAIGDIHGCPQSMDALLDKLKPYYDRPFVFIGDYIDRGPDSKGVVDRLLQFREEVECVFLRGNHEQMLLNAFEGHKKNLWLMNGGNTTLDSYEMMIPNGELPTAHRDFYEDTRLYYDTTNYFFVHAGLNPAKSIAECVKDPEEEEAFLWERSHLNVFETAWEKKVVFGHTPRPRPLIKDKMIGIDTGCVYEKVGYGKLTAVKLPEEEFVQQVCLDR